MSLGLSRTAAAHFAFLLGLPAILAAVGHTAIALEPGEVTGSVVVWFLTGLIMSAVVGYAVIAWFLRYIVKHSLDVFAVYRLVLAGAVLVWLLGA
jgi:undecaprenyl-diphosphatase